MLAGWMRSDCSGNLRTQNSWADDGGDVNRAGDRVFGQSSRFVLGNCNCILQRDLERPSLNELTEPDDAALGLLVFLMVATLLPPTPLWLGVWALIS